MSNNPTQPPAHLIARLAHWLPNWITRDDLEQEWQLGYLEATALDASEPLATLLAGRAAARARDRARSRGAHEIHPTSWPDLLNRPRSSIAPGRPLDLASLTTHQRQVIALLLAGHNYASAATQLGETPAGIRAKAIRAADRLGLIDPNKR